MNKHPSSNKDHLFNTPEKPAPFSFNEAVAAVFPDMISRSVPGYDFCLEMIQDAAKFLVQSHSNVYDLGCSLGSITLAIRSGILASAVEQVEIYGIDSSAAMLQRAQGHIDAFKPKVPIHLICEDINKTSINNASLVVLAYTLQFIALDQRESLIKKIYQGLNPNGGLIIIEKIHDENLIIQEIITELHHEFKRRNGYSELEIAQKRTALEHVLITETESEHFNRLKNVGFNNISMIVKNYAFAAWLAIK